MNTDELKRLAEVMDRLRSPGGCPWDAEQTHESLLKYLLEESYEYIEAVESGDRAAIKEELGDLLLQVYFHSRIAEEDKSAPFSIKDVAASVTEKLINRHPHVFGDVVANTSEEVKQNWDQIKNAEKGRTSPIDGVPLGQPALQLAAKLLHRAEKNKLARPNTDLPKSILDNSKDLESDLGEAIFSFTAWAVENGIDPEAALRKVSLKYAEKLANEKTL